MFPYPFVKEKALSLAQNPDLIGKTFLAGGLVPWVLSHQNSNRLHNDIDFVVPLHEMAAIRRFLKEHGLYDPSHDSQLLPCNKEQIDFGTEIFLEDLPVSFTPFFTSQGNLIQRDFTTADFRAKDSLVTLRLPGLSLADYITSYPLSHGQKLYCTSLEFIYAKKSRKNRLKDEADLEQMRQMRLDENRLARITTAFSKSTLDIQT